jgi:hypothetical protein
MKTHSLAAILTTCLALQLSPLVLAQNPNDAQGARRTHWRQRLANLSSGEREQFRTAHSKAIQDPEVRAAQARLRQAQHEYRERMRAAMLKADPAIAPVLDKVPQGRAHRDS